MHNWWAKAVEWAERQEARQFVREGDDDVYGAAYDRPPSNLATLRKRIYSLSPVRWKRMQRDFRWMQKQMKKMGLNPEDARWLL